MQSNPTSYGQSLCRRYILALTPSRFYENYRPSWLFGMELDFFFPDHNIAIEFNGDQHYFSTGLSESPSSQIRRDVRKKMLCRERGIKVFVFKAIDLVMCKFRMKLKKTLPFYAKTKVSDLDAEAKRYRKLLREKFHSPTAHRGKGKARQKTVAKLFEAHPPSFEGRWNADKFYFRWNEWSKGQPKCLETVQSFKDAFPNNLRKRHIRELDKISMKWETGANPAPQPTNP